MSGQDQSLTTNLFNINPSLSKYKALPYTTDWSFILPSDYLIEFDLYCPSLFEIERMREREP